jgi:hypothetical protein
MQTLFSFIFGHGGLSPVFVGFVGEKNFALLLLILPSR